MKGQMNQGHLYLGSPAEHPSPFFDLQSGMPRVAPLVLPDDQYENLIAR